MKDEQLVSVLTPVHDGARYIRECADSVLRQTYRNFEYLIVDNSSTDGTVEIARSYAERDARVRVLTPSEFVSADENANRALRLISPESRYVKFVHADDWLFPACLERMVSLAEGHPLVGIVSAYRLEEDEVALKGLPASISVLPGRQAARSALLGGPYPYLFGSPSSVLMRADLVRPRPELYRLDNPHQSDQEACLELLQESDLGFVHEVLTFTRRHDAAESPFFVRVGADHPCRLRLMLRFGPVYLGRSEYQRKLAVRLAEYAFFLLRRARSLRDREFRDYHRGELAALARRIGPLDIGRGVARQLAKLGRRRPLRRAR